MHDDVYFMGLALEQARAAALGAEVPVGAVVVKDGQVIAVGRNAPIALHDPSAHAEIQALRAAAQVLGNYRLDGCELYVTLEPCVMCAGAMLHARLKRVVFGAHEPKTGAAGSVVHVFENTQLNHQTSVVGGVLSAQCGELLQEFFRSKRLHELGSALNTPLREDALRTPEACFCALADFPWHGHYVNNLPVLDGLRMHYLDEGPTQVPLVFLCVHGSADWSYAFRNMLPLWCAAGHRVVVPDLIGFGKSDKPKRTTAHSVEFHQRCLGELIESLDLRNIVLVVQDRSAVVGQTVPLCAPERLKGVVAMQLQASEEDFLAYGCPYPDAGHKAALRAFPLGSTDRAAGLLAQDQIGVELLGLGCPWYCMTWERWHRKTQPNLRRRCCPFLLPDNRAVKKHIYIYSPSGAVRDKAAFKRGIRRLQTLGHEVEVDTDALKSHLRFAGTDENRLAAIHRAAASGADVALISRGGYGLTRILGGIRYKAVAKAIEQGTHFVGMSDFTALQLALLAQTGSVTWAGPALCEGFGVGSADDVADGHSHATPVVPDDIMEDCFNDLLLGQGEGTGWRQHREPQDAAVPPQAPADLQRTVHNAVLWGGNLTLLTSLLGTPYFPEVRGGILFVEDVAEHPYRVERMLTQLLHAGVLGRQRAVLMGQFTEYKLTLHDKGFKLQSVVAWLRTQMKTPVLTNLPYGHVATKVLLPMGAKVDLVVQGRDVLMAWGHIS